MAQYLGKAQHIGNQLKDRSTNLLRAMKRGMRLVMKKNLSILLLLSLMIVSACAPIIPQQLKREITEKITIHDVVTNPDALKRKMILWGGKIIRAVNEKEGTLIEVLQLPLDRSQRPKDVDASEGRFLVLYPGYLDVAIYRPGREITVVGEVYGIRKLSLGEIEYEYPFIKARKIHLWKVRPETIKLYHEYPPYPCWGPYLWGYPYWWQTPRFGA